VRFSIICIDRRRDGVVITNSRSLDRAKSTACRSLVGAQPNRGYDTRLHARPEVAVLESVSFVSTFERWQGAELIPAQRNDLTLVLLNFTDSSIKFRSFVSHACFHQNSDVLVKLFIIENAISQNQVTILLTRRIIAYFATLYIFVS